MILLKNKLISSVYLGLIIVYLLQTVLSPTDENAVAKYDVSPGQLKIVALTIALPYVVIWIIALIGYLRLKAYASLIQNHKDGAAFKTISNGVLILCLWLPITAIVSGAARLYYTEHPEATANLVRLDNYINLIILFAAFIIIGKGSSALLKLIKKPVAELSQRMVLIYIGFTALYMVLVLHDPARQFPTASVPVASYYEPDWLLTLTILIPRLIYWFVGIQAARSIFLYQKHVTGLIYKRALSTLSFGLGAVVIATIVLRGSQSLATFIQDLNFALLLILTYALLIMIAVGYVLIAKGAKNLQRLEEL